MPILIQHHKQSVATARLKKFYSMMQQAILLSENENGPAEDWNKAKIDTVDEDGNIPDSDAEHTEEFFNTYFKKYIKYIGTGKNERKMFFVILNDGSTITMRNGSCTDFRFDYNGKSNPNVLGRDQFTFLMCKKQDRKNYCGGNENKSFCTYSYRSTTREKRLEDCKNSGSYCSGLLELDGWEFKNDYPYRL